MSLIIEGDLSEGWVQGPRQEFPESVYETKLSSGTKGEKSIALSFAIQGGDYNGAVLTKSIGLDLSKKGNQAQWVTLLVAAGVSEEKAKKTTKFDVEKLFGKTFHIYTREKIEGEQYSPRDLVAPAFVESMVAQFGKNGANAVTAAPAGKANGGTQKQHSTPQPAPADDGGELDLR